MKIWKKLRKLFRYRCEYFVRARCMVNGHKEYHMGIIEVSQWIGLPIRGREVVNKAIDSLKDNINELHKNRGIFQVEIVVTNITKLR